MITPSVGGVGLAGPGELAVAARLGGEVDDHRAGLHLRDGLGGDQLRRRAAGDERGRDDHVGLADLDRSAPRAGLLLLRRELAGVAALGLGVADALDLEELRAQRLDLLLDGARGRRTRSRPRRAGARWRSPAGRRRRRRARAPARAGSCPRRSSASGRSAAARRRRSARRGSRRRSPGWRARPSTGRARCAGSSPSRTRWRPCAAIASMPSGLVERARKPIRTGPRASWPPRPRSAARPWRPRRRPTGRRWRRRPR